MTLVTKLIAKAKLQNYVLNSDMGSLSNPFVSTGVTNKLAFKS